jgi:DNA topoisomerase-2
MGVECKKIKVDIDPQTAEIVIWNDGQTIPLEMNEATHLYNPELIFGNLLTSSNYNDEEERLSSGRNGLGVKLTNVFSKEFQVECGDGEKVYKQTWTGHMRKVSKPKIKTKKNTGFTCIRFIPDLELFGMEKLDDTMIGLFHKTCVDMSMVTNLPVLLNGEKIHIKSLKDYALLYPQKEEKPLSITWNNNDLQKKKGEELEVVICPSFDEEFHDVAFVNGMYTKEGGAHVDTVASEFCKGLLTKINKGRTTNLFTVKDVRPQFMIFVRAVLVNPTFSNQNKTRLQSPTPKVEVDAKFIQTVCSKWDFMEKMNDISKAREFISLKKTEKKRGGFKRIEGLDHANKQGTKESKDCTLILCEGLSARTYAMKGAIQVGWDDKKGRDYWGVFPLRGKILNVLNASTSAISGNREVTSIIQALNLKYKTDYTKAENFDTLSYGRVMILTDADTDGIHIASLIINMFYVLFKSLLQREEPFLYLMMTPVAKIFPTSSQPLTFYNDFDYQKELEKLTGKRFTVRYYKGLGTSNDQEIKDTFGVKVVSFQLDKEAEKNLTMVFSKNEADERKRWMERYDPESYTNPENVYDISTFINQDHIRFSIDDCKRNIPNLVDGLKWSQRKIMFTVFKRNLTFTGKSMKVAQLAAATAETSNYHHGEVSLQDTIVKLAQDFTGSLNNVPLLFKDGQFGSKSSMGKDAANARYIFTKMMKYTRILYPETDDDLLTYTLDDGLKVEPDFYIPILPMILVNGIRVGIGTGWSCSLPSHNPLEVVQCIRNWMNDKDGYRLPELTPYFNGFTGRIEKIDKHKYRCYGSIVEDEQSGKKRKKTETHRITEIPVDCSIDKMKEILETLYEEKKLKSLKNYSTANKVDFHFTPSDLFKPSIEKLNLSSDINLTNIVLFNDGKIKKYHTLHEIFIEFCKKRYALYGVRKQKLIRQL